jgi:hypothetical protein
MCGDLHLAGVWIKRLVRRHVEKAGDKLRITLDNFLRSSVKALFAARQKLSERPKGAM